jgi:glycosyltransferase involved in cell wall biosynthesis
VAFHHFAYVTEAQAAFKEHYYGYKGARERWRALQGHRGSGALKDYFAWVTDNTVFDDADHYLIEPTARCDKASGRWTFAGAGASPGTAVRRPRIVIDGIFWQYLASGIGRLWENVLREWVASGFIDHVTLLDRSGTAPRIEGVHYWTIARHDYARTGGDSVYLESVCRRLDADLFVSTYYSLPTTTPSFFAGYDMIPEVLGFPLDDEAWNEKRRAILHASAHAMISMNSARDLESLYPSVAAGSTCVAYCGVDPIFTRPDQAEVDAFKQRHGLNGKRYVLMVGERRGFGGYKNGALVFRALAGMADGEALTLLCAGGQPDIEPELRELAPGLDVRRIAPGDLELRAAYAGAHALLYPSKYEGFGMPPLESMACGTPAIVCRNSSLPEVAGDAAIYVDADDPAEMIAAIRELHDPATRADLIARGSRQAVRFTFAGMAGQLANALVATHERLLAGTVARPGEVWSELRRLQQTCQAQPSGIGVTPAAADAGAAAPMVGLTSDVTLAEALRTIDAMRLSPFWKARELTIRVLREIGLRSRA